MKATAPHAAADPGHWQRLRLTVRLPPTVDAVRVRAAAVRQWSRSLIPVVLWIVDAQSELGPFGFPKKTPHRLWSSQNCRQLATHTTNACMSLPIHVDGYSGLKANERIAKLNGRIEDAGTVWNWGTVG